MNGLTTIAAIPTGAGCAASLPAEVQKAPKVEMRSDYWDEQLTGLHWAGLVWPELTEGRDD